jgi:predicted O-methyltransferase YrrM
MKHPFDIINERLPLMHGWASEEKAQRLFALVISINAETSVEIGVYGGKSFLGLALGHAYISKGTAHAVDPWSNDAAVEGLDGQNREFWKNNPLEQIHESFVHHMKEVEAFHRVQVHRQKSDDVTPPESIDILHIDGSHTEQAVRDASRYAKNVRVGGFCVMDDETWQNGNDKPVERAVGNLIEMGFVRLYPLGTGAVYQRVK